MAANIKFARDCLTTNVYKSYPKAKTGLCWIYTGIILDILYKKAYTVYTGIILYILYKQAYTVYTGYTGYILYIE